MELTIIKSSKLSVAAPLPTIDNLVGLKVLRVVVVCVSKSYPLDYRLTARKDEHICECLEQIR